MKAYRYVLQAVYTPVLSARVLIPDTTRDAVSVYQYTGTISISILKVAWSSKKALEHLNRIDQIPKPNAVENIKTRHLVENFFYQ